MAIIGIDLGTTNSLVSVFKDGKAVLIPNQFGEVLTPSVVSIVNNEIIIGKIAQEKLITESEITVSAFKTFMGSNKKYSINNREYTPVDLSSMIIRQLVNDAKEFLNEEIQEAIISVPAYFNDAKRQATKQAGELAGIKVERIINEPSAAALASRVHKTEYETLLVFDLGGGTLDVSIVDCFDNVIEIVAVSGDNHLGGEDFNSTIKNYMLETYHLNNLSLKDNAILTRNIEEMKKSLSSEFEVKREIFIAGRTIEMHLSKEILLKISDSLLYKIKNVIKRALKDADMKVTDINRLIMVGGSSRLIVVQEFLEYLFQKQPEVSEQVDHLVGLGCGYVAGIKERNGEIKDKVLTDICPFSLGVDIYNQYSKDNLFSAIIERNTTLPCSKKGYYTTIKDRQTKVEFNIYQGEELVAKKNHFIGEITACVPSAKAGEEGIEICFTYDINGILCVDVLTLSTGKLEHKVFTSQECVLSELEMQEHIKELEKLKIQKNENSELQYLYEKAYRIFEESTGEKREYITGIINKLADIAQNDKLGRAHKETLKIEEELENLTNQSPFIFEEEGLIN